MGKTFRDRVKAMNAELNRDLRAAKIKHRVEFHRASDVHGIQKNTTRLDRRTSKVALRQQEW